MQFTESIFRSDSNTFILVILQLYRIDGQWTPMGSHWSSIPRHCRSIVRDGWMHTESPLAYIVTIHRHIVLLLFCNLIKSLLKIWMLVGYWTRYFSPRWWNTPSDIWWDVASDIWRPWSITSSSIRSYRLIFNLIHGGLCASLMPKPCGLLWALISPSVVEQSTSIDPRITPSNQTLMWPRCW